MDEVDARAKSSDRPPLGSRTDHISSRQHFLAKVLTQSFDTLFVKILSRKKLRLSFRVKE